MRLFAIVILVLLLSIIIYFQQGPVQLKERFVQLEKKYSKLRERKEYCFDKVHPDSITAKTKPEKPGIVKSIMYSKNKPSTIISGINRVLYEGNTIHGVTIVKIHKDKVELTKNGHKWTQEVGEESDPDLYR